MLFFFVGHVQAGQATVAVQKANETYNEWNGTSYHPVDDRRSVGSQNAPPKQVSHSKFGQAGQRAAVNKPPVRKLAQPRSALGAERVGGLISVWRDDTALGKGKEKPHIRARSPPRKIVRPQVQQKKPNEAVKKGPVSGSLSPPRKIVRPQVQQKRPTEAVKKGPVSGGSLVVKDGKRKSNASQSPRGYVSVELSRGKGYAYVRHIKPGSDTRQQMAERTSSDRHFNLESEYSPRKQSGSWHLFHPHRAQKQGKFSPFQRLSGEPPRNEYLSSNTFGETTVLSELNYTSVPLSPGDSSTISTAHLPTEGQIVGFEHQASTWEYQTLALPSQGPRLQATEKVSIAQVQQKLKLPLGTKAAD